MAECREEARVERHVDHDGAAVRRGDRVEEDVEKSLAKVLKKNPLYFGGCVGCGGGGLEHHTRPPPQTRITLPHPGALGKLEGGKSPGMGQCGACLGLFVQRSLSQAFQA